MRRIQLIDFALQRMAEGKSSIDAIHDASIDRFRPIIMTTLAALMGALPIALLPGMRMANSSPPKRAQTSNSRIDRRSTSPMARSTASPPR